MVACVKYENTLAAAPAVGTLVVGLTSEGGWLVA